MHYRNVSAEQMKRVNYGGVQNYGLDFILHGWSSDYAITFLALPPGTSQEKRMNDVRRLMRGREIVKNGTHTLE